MIRDLDEFMAYPWGRVSLQVLVSSLFAKDEVALSQESFAVRGYVDEIQMVMNSAVPALKERSTPSETSRLIRLGMRFLPNMQSFVGTPNKWIQSVRFVSCSVFLLTFNITITINVYC